MAPWALLCMCLLLSCHHKSVMRDEALAKSYFTELETLLNQEGGRLWGRSLYAPTLFVNAETRQVYANQAGPDGLFALDTLSGIYTGQFPIDKNPANSVVELGGMQWVMALWPLPEDALDRQTLLVHETFHYHQPALGLFKGMNVGNHLDKQDARIWLKMEWNALVKAIVAPNEQEREGAIADALAFRARRRALYPEAAEVENAYEIMEGLPDYTAFTLCYPKQQDLQQALVASKERNWLASSYIYSFAYFSGNAYGCLLDQVGASWRSDLQSSDNLAELLRARLNLKPKTLDSISLPDYGYDTILAYEQHRQAQIDSICDQYRTQFLKDSVLVIPLIDFGIGFNPSNIQDLSPYGTVYPNIRITGHFGVVDLEQGGCLVSPDWSLATLPWSGQQKGDWTLTLNSGFTIQEPTADAPLQRRIVPVE